MDCVSSNGKDIHVASGLVAGTNIFAVGLDEVAQRLETTPWIKQALVMRKPPDRIAVDIVEHRQVAWVDLGQMYGIASDGVLLPAGRAGDQPVAPPRNLPVISGLSVAGDSLHPGSAVPDSALLAILRWWEKATTADEEFCLNVASIQPMSGAGIRLRLVGDGPEFRLPANEAARQLRTIRKLMPRVHQNHPDPAYIDLRYAGQMVVGKRRLNRDELGRGAQHHYRRTRLGHNQGLRRHCRAVAERRLRIIGIGQCPSEGMQRGTIVDAEKTVEAVGAAMRQAELMAGVAIDSVYVGIAGEYIASLNSTGMVVVGDEGGWTGAQDRAEVLEQPAWSSAVRPRGIAHFAARICR